MYVLFYVKDGEEGQGLMIEKGLNFSLLNAFIQHCALQCPDKVCVMLTVMEASSLGLAGTFHHRFRHKSI